MEKEKIRFFFKNFVRGLIWLFLLTGLYLLFKKILGDNFRQELVPLYEYPVLVYLIYSLSEILFGIIPPEVFMIWGLHSGEIVEYMLIISLLAVISYVAGVIGFYIGAYLNRIHFFSKLKKKTLGKYEKYFIRFGDFIIVVAAMTPLPFSGISMLVGSVCFPVKRYLLFALTRFIRFAVYSFFIWKANML